MKKKIHAKLLHCIFTLTLLQLLSLLQYLEVFAECKAGTVFHFPDRETKGHDVKQIVYSHKVRLWLSQH